MKKRDFSVENAGCLILFRPLTEEGRTWLEENTASDAQWWAGALVVEPRYAAGLAAGILAECEDCDDEDQTS